MKYEWKKEEKEYYLPNDKPTLVEIPPAKYICIKGKGNPNCEDFSLRIGALYSISYAIKMMPKKGIVPMGYFEYSVYPLEGLWDLTDEGKNSNELIKDELLYTIMIKQPSFVDDELFNKALEITKKKKSSPLLDEVFFDEMEDGLCVQILHNGSYDTEVTSFNKMKEYISNNGYKIRTLVHREIYLSDARKVDRDKLKTVLRYKVERG